MKTDLLIIGGTAAGTAAAASARRADPQANILLVESGGDVSYSTCEMPMYAGGSIDERSDLVRYSPERFADTFSVDVRPHTTITGFSTDRKEALIDGDTNTIRFGSLILATGARAVMPEVLMPAASNVHVLRTLSDADAVRTAIDTEGGSLHHAVIVGGGYVGLEVAHALREKDVRVTLVQPEGHVLRSGIHAGLAKLVTARMEQTGVSVRHARVTGADRSSDGRVLALSTDDGEKIGCQFVLVATGIVPRTDLAMQLGIRLDTGGAILVNDQMRTNKPGIWACGDAVMVPDVVTGAPVWAPLAMQAYRTGRVAGTNAVSGRGARAASKPAKIEPVVPTYAVHCFGLDIAHAGMRVEEALAAGFKARACDITGASHSRLLGGSDVHIRLVFDDASGRVLGAETVGRAGTALRMNVVAALMRLRGTVNDLAAADTVYHPLVAPMHDPLRVAASEAQKMRNRSEWD